MKCGECLFRFDACLCPAFVAGGLSCDEPACAPMELALALADQMESDSGDIDGNWPAAERLRSAAERFKK